MKKIMIVAILTLCSATLAFADWNGWVKYGSTFVDGAEIKAYCVTCNKYEGTTTSHDGFWILNEANGMKVGHHYHWIYGNKSGIGDGYTYIDWTYDPDDHHHGVMVYLDTMGK